MNLTPRLRSFACWCDQYDEARGLSVRCMSRALDLGCCGNGGPCGCSPIGMIKAQVAHYAQEHPGLLA